VRLVGYHGAGKTLSEQEIDNDLVEAKSDHQHQQKVHNRQDAAKAQF
jgi:hypothetical protein